MFPKFKFSILLLYLTGCSFNETTINLGAESVAYIYDGDTITLDCIAGYPCPKNKTKVRVKGVDTPEIKAACERERVLARAAKQHTVEMLRGGKEITLIIDDLNSHDRYQRLLAYVYVDGIGLHDSLINHELGRRYYGNKRKSWC